MRNCFCFILCTVFVLLCPAFPYQQVVYGAEPDLLAGSGQASLKDLGFVKGLWSGKTANGAYVEEYWSSVQGDSIIGHCRFVKDGKTTFYELMTIVSTGSGTVLRMRHFNGEFVPWPEKEESGDCLLVKCQPGKEVVFDNQKNGHRVRVIYERSGVRTLAGTVEDTQGARVSSYPFEYTLNE